MRTARPTAASAGTTSRPRRARQGRGRKGEALPEWSLISIAEPSPHDRDTLYIAATRYKHDDLEVVFYKTADAGKTWTKIVGGIPATEFTPMIREVTGAELG